MKESRVIDHITELKNYLLLSFIVFSVCFIGIFALSKSLMLWLISYYDISVFALSPIESVAMQLKVTFVIALIVSLPVLLYCLYRYCSDFIVVKKIYWTITILYVLGLLGLILGSTIFSKAILDSFASLSFVENNWSLESVVGVVISTALTVAIALQLWVIIPFLGKIGLVNYAGFKAKRLYIHFILLAVLTFITPDPTMLSSLFLYAPIALSTEGGFMIERLTAEGKANVGLE